MKRIISFVTALILSMPVTVSAEPDATLNAQSSTPDTALSAQSSTPDAAYSSPESDLPESELTAEPADETFSAENDQPREENPAPADAPISGEINEPREGISTPADTPVSGEINEPREENPETVDIVVSGGADGARYEAYRLFDHADGWTLNEKYSEIPALSGADPLLALMNLRAGEAQPFADLLLKQLTGDPYFDPDASSVNGAFRGIPAGYYLISEAKTGTRQDSVSLAILCEAARDTTVFTKEGIPSLSMKVAETNDSSDAPAVWQDAADADIGDTVFFRLEADIPTSVGGYGEYYFRFTAKFPEGLAPRAETISAYIGGIPLLTAEEPSDAPLFPDSATAHPDAVTDGSTGNFDESLYDGTDNHSDEYADNHSDAIPGGTTDSDVASGNTDNNSTEPIPGGTIDRSDATIPDGTTNRPDATIPSGTTNHPATPIPDNSDAIPSGATAHSDAAIPDNASDRPAAPIPGGTASHSGAASGEQAYGALNGDLPESGANVSFEVNGQLVTITVSADGSRLDELRGAVGKNASVVVGVGAVLTENAVCGSGGNLVSASLEYPIDPYGNAVGRSVADLNNVFTYSCYPALPEREIADEISENGGIRLYKYSAKTESYVDAGTFDGLPLRGLDAGDYRVLGYYLSIAAAFETLSDKPELIAVDLIIDSSAPVSLTGDEAMNASDAPQPELPLTGGHAPALIMISVSLILCGTILALKKKKSDR